MPLGVALAPCGGRVGDAEPQVGGGAVPLVGCLHVPGRVSLGGLAHGLGLVLGGWLPEVMGEAGVKVRVKCISPCP